MRLFILMYVTGCSHITHYNYELRPYTITHTYEVCDNGKCKVVSEVIQ